jgi:hypothetical protein
MSTVGPPEDEEDVFHGGEAAGVAVTAILLGLAILHGCTAVEPLEHVALLEGVVDWRLVVGTWLLQHVVENPRASRGWSRAPSSWVNSGGDGRTRLTATGMTDPAGLTSRRGPV